VLLSAQHAFWSVYCETTCGLTYSRTLNQATSPAACPNGWTVTKNIPVQKTEEMENGAKVCGVGCHRDANGQGIELIKTALGSEVNHQRRGAANIAKLSELLCKA
jgi:hypothetical protein